MLARVQLVAVTTFFFCAGASHAQSCADNIQADENAFSLIVACLKAIDAENSELREELNALKSSSANSNSQQNLIPQGAVMAFDLSPTMPTQCPEGWRSHREARGRMIVGAGEHANKDANGEDVIELNVGETGGAEYHTITLEEMPSHSHPENITLIEKSLSGVRTTRNAGGSTIGEIALPPNSWSGFYKTGNSSGNNTYYVSFRAGLENQTIAVGKSAQGGGEAHNNMPPYLALLYCIKE